MAVLVVVSRALASRVAAAKVLIQGLDIRAGNTAGTDVDSDSNAGHPPTPASGPARGTSEQGC